LRRHRFDFHYGDFTDFFRLRLQKLCLQCAGWPWPDKLSESVIKMAKLRGKRFQSDLNILTLFLGGGWGEFLILLARGARSRI